MKISKLKRRMNSSERNGRISAAEKFQANELVIMAKRSVKNSKKFLKMNHEKESMEIIGSGMIEDSKKFLKKAWGIASS